MPTGGTWQAGYRRPVGRIGLPLDLPTPIAAIQQCAEETGDLEVVITCEVWSAEGGYIVHVDVPPHLELLFEVDDWVEGVRVMDPHGEDVSVAEAVDYFAARADGRTPDELVASHSAVSPFTPRSVADGFVRNGMVNGPVVGSPSAT